jgi:hypothetical protein
MKFALYILKASIPILLIFLGINIGYFCFGKNGIDPIEMETIGMVVFVVLGIGLSWFLIRRAERISPVIFWICFLLYLPTFTLPALVTTCIVVLFMTSG